MKTKILMTVSFVATMAVTVPALADSSVLCSVRQGLKNGSVGAAYTPGVDVHGKPVVSADLAPAPMAVPKSMTIPLTMDMAQRFNSVLPTGAKMEAQVGTVDIMQDGRVMINGKDMSGPADAVCTSMAKQKAAALKTNDAPKVRKKKSAPKPAVVEAAPAPAPEAVAAPVPAPAPEPVPSAPAPQVLDAAPPAMPAPTPAPEAAAPVAPQPTPMATEPAPVAPTPPAPTPVVPAPAAGAVPTPPASGAIVSPTEGDNVPRPPLDPLTGAPSPAPAPAPAAGGTLSGGSQ